MVRFPDFALYKLVDIHEIVPTTPAGYFDYLIERGSVFEDARSKPMHYSIGLRAVRLDRSPERSPVR